ncbi:MAG TPA: FHA domain-containing protein [Anaerolineaceae bacterium]|nr:FHA domain-containing protein [Anaerolineaceae bacterium]HPN50762.1 FHA domain-containing protein [Anaerolineaceae bacterium]
MSEIIVLVLRVMVALALYGFLGWAFYTIWQDLKTQSEVVQGHTYPALIIRREGDAEGKSRRYVQPEITIGRDPSCDLPIPNTTISAHHARLAYHHRQWWVEDQQSTNGTFLNQERVLTPTVIVSGDELRCGQVTLTVTFDASASS